MIALKIKRVYEDGTILYIHPKTGDVYLFQGDKFKNRYKIEGSMKGIDFYEMLLNKPCNCEFIDYVLSANIDDKVLKSLSK